MCVSNVMHVSTIATSFQEMVLSRDHMVRDISQKDKLLAQKDTLIADKEATIVTERERAFAEREALIQVAVLVVTLCPTPVHFIIPLLIEMFTDLFRHTENRLRSKMLSWQEGLPTFNRCR